MPTIRDVAHAAGVSPITVSRALRGSEPVSTGARGRIERAVARLGYVANPAAGSLAGARSRIVPVLVPRIHNAFFSETIEAIAGEFAATDLQILIGVHGYDPQRELDELRSFLPWRPRAVVLAGADHLPATRRLLRAEGVPVVEVWDLTRRPIDTVIGFSHIDVGSAVGRFALSAGARHPASIGAYLARDLRARRRLAGYRDHLAAAGRGTFEVAFDEPSTVEHGALGIARILATRPRPDFVFCSNDVIALGALFECQRRGIGVPEEIAVVGFGDLPAGRHCVPPLTTVRPRGEEIGRLAARHIVAHLQAGSPAPRHATVHDTGFELVLRASSRPLRPAGSRRAAAVLRPAGPPVLGAGVS